MADGRLPNRRVKLGTGNATTLHVALIAGGQDPAGSRSGYVLCTSKGFFEEEFAARDRAKLAGPA